jgi:uncharacterized membrane protein
VARHDTGPRRSSSVDSYLRETRAAAAVAMLALIGGVVSDVLARHFWSRNSLFADLISSLIVVMLSVAVVNEVVERGRRRRWSVVAQYVMLALVRNARMIWTGVMEMAGLMPAEGGDQGGGEDDDSLEEAARAVRDTERLTAGVREALADEDRRRRLHEEISEFVAHGDEVLGRWASVMLNADAYAEIIDRHVELVSDVAWVGSILDHYEPLDAGDDPRQRRMTRSSPAVQIEGAFDDQRLAERIVTIAQMAEQLDRGTLQLALRIVPLEWWAARLGTTPPPLHVDSEAKSHSTR